MTIIGILTLSAHASDHIDKTPAIRSEVSAHNNPNLTKDTHPVIYEMVQELVAKAGTTMPKYITTYSAETAVVAPRSGVVRAEVLDILAYIDAIGDLYICKEILTDLSYEEIRGIVAIAVAEKSTKSAIKLASIAVGTFGATLAAVYCLNKCYDLKLGTIAWKGVRSTYTSDDALDVVQAILFVLATPAAIVTKLASNNFQKKIDIEAAHITEVTSVIDGLESLQNLQEKYRKENIVSRIAEMLRLKSIYNTVFYPIRASTVGERVDYLKRLA